MVKLKKAEAVTDARGEFAVRVPAVPAKWRVDVKVNGYRPEQRSVSVEGEQRVDLSIILEPAAPAQGGNSMRKILNGSCRCRRLGRSCGLACAGSEEGFEDRQTRSVQGVVTNNADAPLEGAVVQLKDTKTLQIRSFITKQNGTYHFHSLNPDIDYELKADHQGATSGSKTLSSFDSRKSAVINLKINK